MLLLNNKIAPSPFHDYFEQLQHEHHTRGNNANIRLPKVKTESGRKCFKFQGALIFNQLPANLKNEKSIVIFKNKIKELIK